jgi:hypothetical protein
VRVQPAGLMRINISSRELRAAHSRFIAGATPVAAAWQHHDKLVQFVSYRAFSDVIEELAAELEHPEYDHLRAVRLARQVFDGGLAFVQLLDEERTFVTSTCTLLDARSAAVVFMETVASYLSPFSSLRAA